ncbi:MAG: alanine--tRNA ligase [bacterium]
MLKLNSKDLRKIFLKYFKDKDHKIVSSSSLIPDDDSVLLTTAGMQQFVPYLSGKVKPPHKRMANVQKCFRTGDIDEVGDDYHHTFFEMMGNWSFGDYFKKETIEWAFKFLTEELAMDKERLWATIFEGKGKIAKDTEALEIWKKYLPEEKIKEFGMTDNFWGPTAITGPCGPSSEIHYDRGEEFKTFQIQKCSIDGCGPNCKCGRFVEIWNLVFMQFNKNDKGELEPLPQKNIDTGAGLERLAAILQNKYSDYETDLFSDLMLKVIDWVDEENRQYTEKQRRIICDHIRAAVFLASDGILPSNEDRGYIMRRIIRRVVKYADLIKIKEDNYITELAEIVIHIYKDNYKELNKNKNRIIDVIENEKNKFLKSLKPGNKRSLELADQADKSGERIISGKDAFDLFSTYGYPVELMEETYKVDKKSFYKELKKHQAVSRAGAEKKFGGVGQFGEQVVRQHTATHLLQQALRDVLGDHVKQAGSDLTPDRLRFDFTHPDKLTEEEKQKVEDIVNEKIEAALPMVQTKMPYEEAIKKGAIAFFKEKYPEIVSVYEAGDYSMELCGGPHVKNTSEIGAFKITSEKSSSAGVRRIKAIIGEKAKEQLQ